MAAKTMAARQGTRSPLTRLSDPTDIFKRRRMSKEDYQLKLRRKISKRPKVGRRGSMDLSCCFAGHCKD
jgi:hypothetical protein